VAGLSSSLYFPYPHGTCDRFLVFLACNLPVGPNFGVGFNGQQAALRALSGNGDLSTSIWEVPGAGLPAYLPLAVSLPATCDAVAFVLPLFDVGSLGHDDLALGSGASMSQWIHGVGTGSLLFTNLGFPGQVFDSFGPPQTYIHSLGAFNGRAPHAFHFVTAIPGEPGGPTVLGDFSQSTPWAACFLEVK
jgi:hypothetical protein